MYKIGFQNFRRFINFEPIEYRGITFLVGRNNAGKSTLVKALLLLNDFFKSGSTGFFSFGSKILEDANIVTYGRARNRKATEDYVKFIFQIDKHKVEIVLSGDEDSTIAVVTSIQVDDLGRNFQFLFEPRDKSITISRLRSIDTEVESKAIAGLQKFNSEILRLKELINTSELKKSSKEYITLLEELSILEYKRNVLSQVNDERKESSLYSVSTHYEIGDLKEIMDFALAEAKVIHDKEFVEVQQDKEAPKEFEKYRGLKEDSSMIEDSFKIFYDNIKSSLIFYLGANPAKQSALFSIRDRNNALSQSIHDFYQSRISPGEVAHTFVEKWMKSFEVGDSFRILIHAGEAYEFKVVSNNTEIHLADKGMGSIQAMLLILRIACVIHKTRTIKVRTTVIIEEPELNLHPALQSKLSELFLDVNQNYKLDFIVETHSEYILRRSQVLVAEKEFAIPPNENPFCAYYFPKEIDLAPYQLIYQADGVFDRNFGSGFFDEASSSTLELLKLKRKKQS